MTLVEGSPVTKGINGEQKIGYCGDGQDGELRKMWTQETTKTLPSRLWL
jgi:hypothetical protein